MPKQDLPARIALALQVLVSTGHGDGSLHTYGREIAEAEGRTTPYDAATIDEWLKGVRCPTFGAISALARIAYPQEENQRWLLYGPDSGYGVNEADWQRYTDTVP
jgi:hypothetical protein